MIKEGCEYLVACFEGAGEGAGDFGGADAFSVTDGYLAHRDGLFRGFELHLYCPSEGFVLHIQGEELWVSNRSEGT